ncbi:hypothetical protein RvVAT039_07580 [Agrobacterium vitis]|uniref:hypothetical protein n=1 Tax=Agrobacterium vitis TaxID=373 RepID=UPI0015D97EDD|nr:hypothetical protein [Agrobacterium vitis]BCH63542.1 hypothetical protein RvVAT039_07580 [Agrobacterium vitis]
MKPKHPGSKDSSVQTHVTPRAETLTPPSKARNLVLPLVEIGSKDFEELCMLVLRDQFDGVVRANLKRRSGYAQYGVDVEGFDSRQDPFVVVSCKCYLKVTPSEVRTWINDFVKHLDGHWKGKNVRHFILAMTVPFSVDELNDEARKLTAVLAERGIKLVIWDLTELSPLAAKDLERVSRFFDKYWVDALTVDLPSLTTTAATTAPISTQGVLGGPILAQIEAIYTQPLNDVHAKTLETCVAEIRKGRRSPFQEWLTAARANPVAWGAISKEVRAKGFTIAAMIAVTDMKLAEARDFLDEAEQYDHAADRTARAMLIRNIDGLPAATAYLVDPVDRKEREVLAGFQLESGEFALALETLKPITGQDLTSEVMRLRAIATAFLGKKADALKQIRSAVAKDPHSAMSIFTLGQILFASALTHGVQPQFGSLPNPVSRTLVLPGAEAKSLLVEAAAEFEKLRLVVEGSFQREVEIWKLAALLLNPDARTKARATSRALLARPDLDPFAVIWCLQYGIPMKKGQVRKTLGDALRRGKGTPAHVAVLALMASSMTEPEKGRAVIDRFADLFPQNSEFLAHWRDQFTTPADGEPFEFPSAVRSAMTGGDRTPLMTVLLSEETGPENLLSGAEALLSMEAFDDLNRLRSLLVSTGTLRGIELAAVAALNSNEPSIALGLMDDAVASGVEESGRMMQVRLKAHEALAQHSALITRLESELNKSSDPLLRDQLMTAYLRIGALDRFKAQAEIAIRDGLASDQQAIRMAYVLRDFSPETARLALGTVATEEIPDNMAQALLSLSSHLGLTELQDKALGKLIASPVGQNHLRRFDSVEEVLAFIQQNTAEYRKKLDEWLHGIMPAAGAMNADGRDFAMLFLAAPKMRTDRAGNFFPMLLRSGIPGREPPPVVGERPVLHIDMGALLIADRLDLLSLIERCFVLHVPESLPEALIETKAALREVSTVAAQAVRSIRSSQSAITIVDDAHVGGVEITSANRDMPDEGKAALLHALDQAHFEGHVTNAQRADIIVRLELQNVAADTSAESILLSGSSIRDFAHLGLLDPLSRGYPLNIRNSEVDRLVESVEIAEDEQGVRNRISALSSTVAAKLSSSEWKTIISADGEERSQAARLAPHARCLIEALPHGDTDGILFWIEDRVFSRQVLPVGLDLPMVVAHLVRAGEMTHENASAVFSELRRIGYLFIPIDAAELGGIIGAASIVNGELVENDQIADIRRWFARDVLHLRYLDQTPQLDRDGMITGEARRMLDLSHLATDLLDLIWRSDASVQEKSARSTWVWSNLRLDYLPSPPAADVPEARRQISCLNAMQVLTLPIRAELGSAKLPVEVRQEFVDWAMHAVIRPMAGADGVAEEDIAAMIASLISRTLEVQSEAGDDRNPDLDALMARHFKVISNDFVNLLPPDWRKSITDRNGIAQALRRENIMLLELAPDSSVGVQDVSEAMSKCRSASVSETEIKLEGRHTAGKLFLGQGDDGFPTATIKSDGQTFDLQTATLALVDPDESIRRRMLMSLPRNGNVGNPLSDEFLQEIAGEEDVFRRVERFNARLGQDFARHRDAMWDRVVNGGSILLTDLALPDPGQLLNFLGLDGRFRGSGAELVEASAKVLKSSLGIERAVSRLCGVPIALPDDLILEFGQSIGKDCEAWPVENESLPSTVTRMLAFASAGGSLGDIEEWLSRTFSHDRAELFMSILRLDFRYALRSDEWTGLPSDLALCLMWIHADQITRNLVVDEQNLAGLTKWLKKYTPSAMLDDEREMGWDRWVVWAAAELSADRLLAAAVAELVRRNITVPDSLKNTIGHDGEKQWMPSPSVLVPNWAAPSGYWPSVDPVPTIVALGWLDPENPFAVREQCELLGKLLSEKDLSDPSIFVPMVDLFIDLAQIGGDQLAELRSHLEALESTNPVAVGGQAYGVFADLVAKVHRHTDDEAGFSEWVMRTAKANQTRWPFRNPRFDGKEEFDRAASVLFNACYVFAWSGNYPLEDRIATLCRLFDGLTQKWPRTIRLALASLDGLARQVDIPTASKYLLPSLLEMRSR